MTAPSPCSVPADNMVVVWALVLIAPILLAAELSQRSNGLTHLPEPETYRSNFSDQTLKSSTWRQPASTVPDWRAPASPRTEWRTETTQPSSQSVERANVDLYPEYYPGGSPTFTPDNQSGIKIFGF